MSKTWFFLVFGRSAGDAKNKVARPPGTQRGEKILILDMFDVGTIRILWWFGVTPDLAQRSWQLQQGWDAEYRPY